MCDYCPVFARHPCTSKEEASRCANCTNRGYYHDFKASEVAEWIRANNFSNDPDIEQAAIIVEERL